MFYIFFISERNASDYNNDMCIVQNVVNQSYTSNGLVTNWNEKNSSSHLNQWQLIQQSSIHLKPTTWTSTKTKAMMATPVSTWNNEIMSATPSTTSNPHQPGKTWVVLSDGDGSINITLIMGFGK